MKIPALLLASALAGHAEDPFEKSGREQYILCAACHGQSGQGTAAAPPLAASEWVSGPAENLIRIQLRGLRGPILVKGVEYQSPVGMPPFAFQSDEQIAAVLSFVRRSFGNDSPAISPAEVTALRGEVGKPQLSAADLIPSAPSAPPTSAVSNKYAHLEAPGKFPTSLVAGILALLTAALAGFKILKKHPRP